MKDSKNTSFVLFKAQEPEQLYDFERTTGLKTILDYQRRVVKRLKDEIKDLQASVDQQLEVIKEVNRMFTDDPNARSCCDANSIVQRTMDAHLQEMKLIRSIVSFKEDMLLLDNEERLYIQPTTEELVAGAKTSSDFAQFFREFPIGFIAFFDSEEISFSLEALITEAETWDTGIRTKFFSMLFAHLNSAGYIFSTFLALVGCSSLPVLTEYIEVQLLPVLNYGRIAFFLFDAENSELVMEKEKLMLKRKVTEGILAKAIRTNKLMIASTSYRLFSNEDAELLKTNKEMLVVPVYCEGSPAAVVLLFDKIGGFEQIDYITAKGLSIFIEQALPVIKRVNQRRENVQKFQMTLDAFLKIINVSDMDTFMKVVPEALTSCFKCDYAQVLKVSQRKRFFWPIHQSKKDRQMISIDAGVTGQCISRRMPLRVTRPESSVHFNSVADRPSPKVLCSSILVCPVFDDDNVPRFAIALYNKQEIETFTDLDISTLKMICDNLYKVLYSITKTAKLTAAVEYGQERIDLYDALTTMLASLTNLPDIDATCAKIGEKVSELLKDYAVDVYYVDRLSKTVNGKSVFEKYHKSLYDSDPICLFARTAEIQESIPNEGDEPILYCGVKSSLNEPIGLFKLSCIDPTKPKNKSIMSLFQSVANVFTMSSKKVLKRKSTAQLKVEQLNTVLDSLYQPVQNANMLQIIRAWRMVVGPGLELSIRMRSLSRQLLLVANLLHRLPADPGVALQIFNEVQLLLPYEEPGDDATFVILPREDRQFQEKTLEFLQEMSQLCDIPEVAEPPQADKVKVPRVTEALEEDVFSSTFSVVSQSYDRQFTCLKKLALDLGVIDFLGIDKKRFKEMLTKLHEFHTSNVFESWKLAVDHCQFAAHVISQVKDSIEFEPVDIAAMYLYLLSLYCRIWERVGVSNTGIIRFCIENGKGMSPVGCFFTVCSAMAISPLSRLSPENINRLMTRMNQFDCSDSFESLYSDDMCIHIVTLARFSYLARKLEDAQHWTTLRFSEEVDSELVDEFKKYQLDFEVHSIILPTCGEFVKRGIKFDQVRKLFTNNLSQIIGNL